MLKIRLGRDIFIVDMLDYEYNDNILEGLLMIFYSHEDLLHHEFRRKSCHILTCDSVQRFKGFFSFKA